MGGDSNLDDFDLPSRKRRGRPRQPRFLAVDFFCGAGGTTRGLIDAGGYVIAGIDKDRRCRRTYVENNPNEYLDRNYVRFLECDLFPRTRSYPDGEQYLARTELDELIPHYRARAPKAPLLFAICAPCQPFTRLTKIELSDHRKEVRQRDANLLTEATKFVKTYQPELVLSENVAGIRDPRYGGIWEAFRRKLKRLGYSTGTDIVCTSNFGIPQFRKRSILLAVKEDLVTSEHLENDIGGALLVPKIDPNAPYVTVRQAIEHLPPIGPGETHPTVPNHRTRNLSELNRRRLRHARPGESNAYLEVTRYGDLTLRCHREVNARLNDRCFGDVYTRMHPDRPSPTITTKCHSITNGRFGHYNTKQIRGISLREAALLQSFGDNYMFYPTHQVEPVARMIGNAVPPKLARFFADYLTNSLQSLAD